MAGEAVRREGASDLGRVEVRETKLPGIGLRHEFITDKGRRLGLVTYRNGRRDIFLGSAEDPDSTESVLVLNDAEADLLRGLLGGARFAEHLDRALADVPGVVVERLPLPVNSTYAGKVLGDTGARTRTGVSIVALVRNREVLAAPGPSTPLQGGDTLIVVGTPDGVAKLGEILSH